MIPYSRQIIDDEDIDAVVNVLRSDFLTTGPVAVRFEQALSERIGAKHAVACSSGTAALHLAAMAIDLGPGQAAVVPSVTFLATANAIRLTGAEVVFADVDPSTGLMLPEHLEEAMARGQREGLDVRAVLPVHLNGQCADISGICSVAEQENLQVIADASHAIGAAYLENGKWQAVGSGRRVCMTTFSFHPVKTIAMGEGGAVTTDDPVLAKRLRLLRNHGMTRDLFEFTEHDQSGDEEGTANPWYYEMHEPGLNYRTSDIHAALGLSQLRKLDKFIEARRELASRYDELLVSLSPRVRPIGRVPRCSPAWHLYPVLIDFASSGITRATVVNDLLSHGISSQVHYLPVHRQPYYRNRYNTPPLAGADAYYASALSLPLYPDIPPSIQESVYDRLASILC